MLIGYPQTNPYNDHHCKFAIQSYNEQDGSTNIQDISRGASNPPLIEKNGLVLHTTELSTPCIGSSTCLKFATTDTRLIIRSDEDFNLYNDDFTIHLLFRITGSTSRNSGGWWWVNLLTYYQDNNNFWRIYIEGYKTDYRYNRIYFQYRYSGTNYVSMGSEVDYSYNYWYSARATRYSNTIYFFLANANSSNPTDSGRNTWTTAGKYLPPFDKAKLIIGAWPETDGSFLPDHTYVGYMNCVAVSKRCWIRYNINPLYAPL